MGLSLPVGNLLTAQWRVISALMLHDLRSRMGGSVFGFVAMGVLWPLSHIFILLAINAGLGRIAPYGESVALWYATGIVPFMAFQYMSRWIMLSVVVNKALLGFPVVKATDLMASRAVIEVLNTAAVVITVFCVFWAMNIEFMPRDLVQAFYALLGMMLLGLAWGIFNAVIASAFPVWITGFMISQILFWMSSGIMFVPDELPTVIRVPLSYLPTVQGVAWMRSAYFDGYGTATLSKSYFLATSVALLFAGLAAERLARGKLMR